MQLVRFDDGPLGCMRGHPRVCLGARQLCHSGRHISEMILYESFVADWVGVGGSSPKASPKMRLLLSFILSCMLLRTEFWGDLLGAGSPELCFLRLAAQACGEKCPG